MLPITQPQTQLEPLETVALEAEAEAVLTLLEAEAEASTLDGLKFQEQHHAQLVLEEPAAVALVAQAASFFTTNI
jgi:hypothetical protein